MAILTADNKLGLEKDEDNKIHLVRKIYGKWVRDNDFTIGEWTNLLEQLHNSAMAYDNFLEVNHG